MTSPQAAQDAQPSRRAKLEEFAAKHPADAFARYGLAMECARIGDTAAAEESFRQLLAEHPHYISGYYQFGQMLAKLERISEAREVLTEGVARAMQAGDPHALVEMQAALDGLQ